MWFRDIPIDASFEFPGDPQRYVKVLDRFYRPIQYTVGMNHIEAVKTVMVRVCNVEKPKTNFSRPWR